MAREPWKELAYTGTQSRVGGQRVDPEGPLEAAKHLRTPTTSRPSGHLWGVPAVVPKYTAM